MTEIKGNIAEVYKPVQNDSMSALKARISAVEAAPQPESLVAMPEVIPAPAATPKQEAPKTEPPKAEEPKAIPDKVPQGLRDDKGEVDIEKTDKTTEHLQKRTQEKEAALARFKDAQKKFTQTSQELSKVEKEAVTQAPPAQTMPDILDENISPEFQQRVIQDLEKSFVPTLVKLIKAVSNQEVGPLKNEFAMTRAQRQESERLKGLEKLAEKGHDWVWTPEGMDKLHTVLDQKPWLKNDPDPYGAAFRFLDDAPSSSGTPRSSAPATGLTPTLGANSAVPPMSAPPAPSTAEVLEKLGAESRLWLSRGQIAKAREIQSQMDKLVRGF